MSQVRPLNRIVNVHLPDKPPSTVWDVAIADGKIQAVEPHDAGRLGQLGPDVLDGSCRLLAPSLCHAHIHLDKCFLLQDPKFSDLQIENGDFQEAMAMTSEAKARFDEDDLLRRGRQLIEESIHYGVTVMRAFVELDGVVQSKCLDAGLKLKEEFKERCEVQLCAFAQLPLFTGDGAATVRRLMSDAATRDGVAVVGSTPYVEKSEDESLRNVQWITSLALDHRKHLDLHLDYFIEEDRQPLVTKVMDTLRGQDWLGRASKQIITLGHCTRLSRFGHREWTRLRQEIGDLPVSFVGLPTSDLFMMRTPDGLRGTLPIISMIKEYRLKAAVAINNVGNAFTPQGNCDPLSLASLGVGLYQAGTKEDAQMLFEAISSRAKQSIGCDSTSTALSPGQPADFVLIGKLNMEAEWRCRKSIAEVVYNPSSSRQTVRSGKLTSHAAAE